MIDLPKSAISPLAIAARLASANNLTEPALARQIQAGPRLPELLWFLQWVSMQPGGIEKFALDVIADSTPHFGPPCLHDESAALTLEQRQELWECFPDQVSRELIPCALWMAKNEEDDRSYREFAMSGLYPKPADPGEEKQFQSELLTIPREKFRAEFLAAAQLSLAPRLRIICLGEKKQSRFFDDGPMDLSPWYCPNLADVLFEAMDLHAARIALKIAETQVVSLVFDRLDFAWSKKTFVTIQGDSRTGKTEAVKAWAAMHPGKARLVSTPSSHCERDLLQAIAESIGLPFNHKTSTRQMKDQIQDIIRHAGLFFIFDEAHFVFPTRFSGNTHPARLDWMRTQIIDRKLPVAFVSTPQAFTHAVEKFQKQTQYNFAQFFGRVALPVVLPAELSRADFMAICKIQGAKVPEEFHKLIVSRAMRSPGYIQSVEAICQRAEFIAATGNRSNITFADVEAAALEVVPAVSAPVRAARPAPAPACETPIRPIAPAPALEMPGRATTPTLQPV